MWDNTVQNFVMALAHVTANRKQQFTTASAPDELANTISAFIAFNSLHRYYDLLFYDSRDSQKDDINTFAEIRNCCSIVTSRVPLALNPRLVDSLHSSPPFLDAWTQYILAGLMYGTPSSELTRGQT